MAAPGNRRIAARGIVAATVAAVLNAGLVAATRALEVAQGFEPIAYPQVVFLTVLGAIAATVVYGLVVRLSANPRRTFVRVAAVALVVSFVPDLLLLLFEPTATLLGVLILMVMHVVAAAVVVGLLTRGVGGAV